MRKNNQAPDYVLWIEGNKEYFEQIVLWAVIHDPEWWRNLCPVLCFNQSTKLQVDDFTFPSYNLVMRGVRFYRFISGTAETPGIVPLDMMRSILETIAKREFRYSDVEVGMAYDLYSWLLDPAQTASIQPLLHILRPGLQYWLPRQKMAHHAVVSGGSAVTSLLAHTAKSMQQEQAMVDQALAGDYNLFEMAHTVLTHKQEYVERIRTGIISLDKTIGGGFAKGEGILILAPPGYGKTMTATNVLAEVSQRGRVSLLISTEEPAYRLYNRVLAARANVPYEILKDGYNLHTLAPTHREKILETLSAYGGRVFIDHWDGSTGATINGGGIEAAIEATIRKAGRLDVLQFDWLGAGLTKESQYDKDKKRMAMQEAADKVAEVAKVYNIAAIAYGQLHKKEAVDTLQPGIAMAVDNKTLDQKMVTVIGLTALTPFFGMNNKQRAIAVQEQNATGEGTAQYRDDQYFYVEKARYGTGGLAPYRRNARYQRLENQKS